MESFFWYLEYSIMKITKIYMAFPPTLKKCRSTSLLVA